MEAIPSILSGKSLTVLNALNSFLRSVFQGNRSYRTGALFWYYDMFGSCHISEWLNIERDNCGTLKRKQNSLDAEPLSSHSNTVWCKSTVWLPWDKNTGAVLSYIVFQEKLHFSPKQNKTIFHVKRGFRASTIIVIQRFVSTLLCRFV